MSNVVKIKLTGEAWPAFLQGQVVDAVHNPRGSDDQYRTVATAGLKRKSDDYEDWNVWVNPTTTTAELWSGVIVDGGDNDDELAQIRKVIETGLINDRPLDDILSDIMQILED